ncbi:MAG: DUF454 domain-containing protein [Nevskiaceae bacterium]|nr:MAG: DUF454 domain-containing protein [Nevskiaceae bacterium]TAM26375.1 MAG: DUF454 domain-containing protein [Nevskiaceae bacterium]
MEPAKPAPAPALRPRWQRWLLAALAWVCIGLAVIGVIVPGMPTTVFVLIAGWAAFHSSPRLHDWLLAHRLFGPMIRNWRAEGAVSRRAKWMASLTMVFCAALLFLSHSPGPVAYGASTIMVVVAIWLWLRPEPRRPRR